MVICNEKKYSPNTEDKYDIELNELAAEYSTLPDKMVTIKDGDHSQDSSLETLESIKVVTNDPTSVPFPPAPQFCSGLSGVKLNWFVRATLN